MRKIKLDTAPSRILSTVLIGDLEESWNYVESFTKVKLDDELLMSAEALCLSITESSRGPSLWVLLPENYTDDLLVHELSHLTFAICKFMNIFIMDNSEELFAYTIEDLFRQIKNKEENGKRIKNTKEKASDGSSL
jgi:hypothetical protein